MDDEKLERARQHIQEEAESAHPPEYDPAKERADLLKRLDIHQALVTASMESFGEFSVAMILDPDNKSGFSDEDLEALRGQIQMFQDIEHALQPRIDRAHRRLEALNQEDLTRAMVSASEGVARATWVLAAATVILALSTVALIWATVNS